jgi:hypothetical protein
MNRRLPALSNDSPPGLEARCDALLESVVEAVAARQESYRALLGRYWQGLRSHTVPPEDGETLPPEPARRPSYQAEDWASFGISLPVEMSCAVQVDTYEGPSGAGWVVSAAVRIDGVLWVRSRHDGPGGESWRTHDWSRS